MIKTLFLFTLLLSVSLAHAQTPDANTDVSKIFADDQRAPLDIQEKELIDRHGIPLHDISFASTMGGRVSAYLVMPPATVKGPFAGIVFLHSGQWDRHEFMAEAQLLAQAGAVSLLLDAPPMRVKEFQKKQDDLFHSYVQMVVDCRRAVDVLEALPAGPITAQGLAALSTATSSSPKKLIDPKRIAYVGHSLGATWGGALAVSERRFKALVLMAGFSEFSTFSRAHTPPAQLEKSEPFLKAVAPVDADRLLPHAAPAALLFQFTEYDQFITHDDAQRSVQSASEPKTVKWYEGAHEFADPRALPDRAEFLHQQIGIAPLRPIILKDLGWDKASQH